MISTSRKPCVVTRSARRDGFTIVEFLVVIAILCVLIALIVPVNRSAPSAARRMLCQSNLKQIAVALINYHSRHGVLPPAYTVDANGKPLHSWRTLILPYLDSASLYRQLDLSKPWDDPVNAEAFKQPISAFRCPLMDESNNRTTYLAVLTPNSCLRAVEPRSLKDITDAHSATLTVIEVDSDHSVPWMAPLDADEALFLSINSNSKLAHSGAIGLAFVDGHVEMITTDMSKERRRAMISINGNEDIHGIQH